MITPRTVALQGIGTGVAMMVAMQGLAPTPFFPRMGRMNSGGSTSWSQSSSWERAPEWNRAEKKPKTTAWPEKPTVSPDWTEEEEEVIMTAAAFLNVVST